MSKLITLLKTLGIPETEASKFIEALKTPETEATFDIKPLTEAANGHYKKLFENDTDVIDKFTSAERNKIYDIVNRELKRTFGLSAEEVKDKTAKEIIELARKKSTESTDKSVTDLQNELIAANNKIKEYEETVIPSKLAEVDAHKKRLSIDNELTKIVGGKKLRVPFEAAYPALNTKLSELYDLDIDDKKQLQVFLKGTKVHPTKADKTGLLTLSDILDTTLKEWKFIEESNADLTNRNKNIIIQSGDDTDKNKKTAMKFPGAEKALKAAEEAKELSKGG